MGGEYEDYITERAEGFRLISNELILKAKEHKQILSALAKRNMTVKEINELYRLPDGTHTKTLKTVYRHLDVLEQLDLIKICGHRKYKGARSLEKLYCRTAKVFSDDKSKKKEWLASEDGKRFLDSLTDVLWLLKEGHGDKTELRILVEQVFSNLQDQTNEMIRKMANDDRFSELIENNSFDHIKALLEIAPHILTLMETPELVEKMRKILD